MRELVLKESLNVSLTAFIYRREPITNLQDFGPGDKQYILYIFRSKGVGRNKQDKSICETCLGRSLYDALLYYAIIKDKIDLQLSRDSYADSGFDTEVDVDMPIRQKLKKFRRNYGGNR